MPFLWGHYEDVMEESLKQINYLLNSKGLSFINGIYYTLQYFMLFYSPGENWLSKAGRETVVMEFGIEKRL
jgi:hypothetical protein